jgi:hypothetical protein
MKKYVVLICSALFVNICLSAQKNDLITIKAGTKVLDYFPLTERYRYPGFIQGMILFKNGTFSESKLNYNYLMNEMEFIRSRDTLAFKSKKDIEYIVVAQDTFFYDKGYIEVISGGRVRVGLKQYIVLKDVVRKNAFGVANRGASVDTYDGMPAGNNFYDLIPNEDIILQKTQEYYLGTPSSGFVQFRKKTVLQFFPQKADEIQSYLKANKVNFSSREDLLRLADYLGGL